MYDGYENCVLASHLKMLIRSVKGGLISTHSMDTLIKFLNINSISVQNTNSIPNLDNTDSKTRIDTNKLKIIKQILFQTENFVETRSNENGNLSIQEKALVLKAYMGLGFRMLNDQEGLTIKPEHFAKVFPVNLYMYGESEIEKSKISFRFCSDCR